MKKKNKYLLIILIFTVCTLKSFANVHAESDKYGWVIVGDQEYYYNADGELYYNQFISFGTDYIYYMGADGSKQHGLVNTSSGLYYMDEKKWKFTKIGWLVILCRKRIFYIRRWAVISKYNAIFWYRLYILHGT